MEPALMAFHAASRWRRAPVRSTSSTLAARIRRCRRDRGNYKWSQGVDVNPAAFVSARASSMQPRVCF